MHRGNWQLNPLSLDEGGIGGRTNIRMVADGPEKVVARRQNVRRRAATRNSRPGMRLKGAALGAATM